MQKITSSSTKFDGRYESIEKVRRIREIAAEIEKIRPISDSIKDITGSPDRQLYSEALVRAIVKSKNLGIFSERCKQRILKSATEFYRSLYDSDYNLRDLTKEEIENIRKQIDSVSNPYIKDEARKTIEHQTFRAIKGNIN